MGRPPKSTQLTGLQKVLADNIRLRMIGAFPAATNESEQMVALAAKSGVAKETIRRTLVGQTSPRLDIVESLARALGVSAATLLTPARDSSNGGELLRARG